MINKVIMSGFLAKDNWTNEDGSAARNTIAVRRTYTKEGEPDTDFFQFVCFGRVAEFLAKYGKKGDPMEVSGRLQKNSYEKDGQRIYTTEIYAENLSFPPHRSAENHVQQTPPQRQAQPQMPPQAPPQQQTPPQAPPQQQTPPQAPPQQQAPPQMPPQQQAPPYQAAPQQAQNHQSQSAPQRKEEPKLPWN